MNTGLVFAVYWSADWVTAWATCALVVVGVVGACLALKTLRDIEAQTTAIQRQTESLVTSERAWILVKVDWVPGYVGVKRLDSSDGGERSVGSIRIYCANEGRSPAWITEVRAAFEMFGTKQSLPAKPSPGSLIHPHPEPVAPGGLFTKDETLYAEGFQDTGDAAVIYGTVKYRDMFKEDRETTFAYTVQGSTFTHLAGYPAYNQNR